jgi:hypothetical protein
MNAKPLVATMAIVLGISIPVAATGGTARAANGECAYGQKSDGTCWDAQATATPTPTSTPTVTRPAMGNGGGGEGGGLPNGGARN